MKTSSLRETKYSRDLADSDANNSGALLVRWRALLNANSKTVFFVGLIIAASGVISPPLALVGGLIYGLRFVNPYRAETKSLSKVLLKASVVALGFGMNLQVVLAAGRTGLVFTTLSIIFTMLVGLGLGRLLHVRNTTAFLITSGTAICGGSAIAAVGPIADADEEEMTVSLGTVFILNSIALLVFPSIGAALYLSQEQFGLWSALAIHDTSSVVGAAARYGTVALGIATTVKLARVLWIVPLCLTTAAIKRKRTGVQWPGFILLFCLAAVINTYVPALSSLTHSMSSLGKQGLTATLFLIGCGVSVSALKKVGWRPLLHGALLWVVVASISLLLIRKGLIGF